VLAGRRPVAKVVAILSALGMPLYLWHKLAELPAAWLGERLGAPIDAGVPGGQKIDRSRASASSCSATRPAWELPVSSSGGDHTAAAEPVGDRTP
jgi:hypothetical protein